MNSPSKLNSYEVDNIFPKESIAPSVKDNKTANFFQPKADIFDEIMKELENAKSPISVTYANLISSIAVPKKVLSGIFVKHSGTNVLTRTTLECL